MLSAAARRLEPFNIGKVFKFTLGTQQPDRCYVLTVREDGGVYSPSLRSRAVRLPPTPCRVCFRTCVFNKFSHFWQKYVRYPPIMHIVHMHGFAYI